MKLIHTYDQLVRLRYNLYNSLFLQLPFRSISETGHYLPLLHKVCAAGLKEGLAPNEILAQFFETHQPEVVGKARWDFLFRVVQYVERQVVLFDAIEDAAFPALHQMDGPGTLGHLFNQPHNKEEREALLMRLKTFGIRIVLTAHPTQFYPGAVLSIITDLEEAIASENFNEVNLLLQQLGRTKFLNRAKPTPLDEAVSLIWYLENIFYQAIPKVFEKVVDFTGLPQVPEQLVQLGFWPGGDRDGNPFVTAEITTETARRMHEAVLRCYLRETQQLKRRLTFPQTDKLARNIEVKLINALYQLVGPKYRHSDDIIDDLKLIRGILRTENNGLYINEIDTFVTKIRTFGFHFASLDIRQDSSVHHLVVREILKSNNLLKTYNQFTKPIERGEFLMDQSWQVAPEAFDGITKETLLSVHAMMQLQQAYGETACHRYIISNTQDVADLFHVFFLFKVCGYDVYNLPVDVVPLFETVADLNLAGRTMETFYKSNFAQHHVFLTRQRQQTIMLGFSDGTKDGGYMTANYAILEAKRKLTLKSRKFDVKVLFFDGRGGPPARGGGETHRFYASMGPEVESHQNQITIQGQTISSKFGSSAAAVYNMEQLLTAGLSVSKCRLAENPFKPEIEPLLLQLAEESLKAYEALKNDPVFVSYLEHSTVLNFYGETNVGSRPVKRNGNSQLKLSDLRAIPFVGAWAQMKQNVPGYYGFGTALQKVNKAHPGALQTLYAQSEFFRVLVQNSFQSLAKSNFQITQHLASHPKYGTFWHKLHQEFLLTQKYLLQISGTKEPLESTPVIRTSIALREELVLPLLIIQQAALMALQNPETHSEKDLEAAHKLVVRCFFGNINSSRNSA